MNEQHEIRSDELADIEESLEREEAFQLAPELDPLEEDDLEAWYQAYVEQEGELS
jgi:hypothetical protein